MRRWIIWTGFCAVLFLPTDVSAGGREFYYGEADWEAFSKVAELEEVALIIKYREGIVAQIEKDYEKAIEVLLSLAKIDVAEAQYALADMYEHGEGIAKDIREARRWYERAAILGLREAQTELAYSYTLDDETGLPEKFEEGLYWMQKAAQPGNPKAYFGLARIYDVGLGVPSDPEKAFGYYRAAAEMGYVDAQALVGHAYRVARGVPVDLERSFRWFYAAATQGHAYAQARVAGALNAHVGVKTDIVRSIYWYKRAARQNEPIAQHGLGSAYFIGWHLPRDLAKSYMWLTLALKQGYEPAQSTMDGLTKLITPAQILEGKARATAWKPRSERLQIAQEKLERDLRNRRQ